jgi:DNA-binding NtrC family response regulator
VDDKMTALLVSDGGEPFEKLELTLNNQGIATSTVRTSAEATELLEQPGSLQMIFTDTILPDGTWADVLTFAARRLVPVVVVSRLVDVRLYIETLERGAFDFIVPPFPTTDLAHIVNRAAWNCRNAQGRQALAAA